MCQKYSTLSLGYWQVNQQGVAGLPWGGGSVDHQE